MRHLQYDPFHIIMLGYTVRLTFNSLCTSALLKYVLVMPVYEDSSYVYRTASNSSLNAHLHNQSLVCVYDQGSSNCAHGLPTNNSEDRATSLGGS